MFIRSGTVFVSEESDDNMAWKGGLTAVRGASRWRRRFVLLGLQCWILFIFGVVT